MHWCSDVLRDGGEKSLTFRNSDRPERNQMLVTTLPLAHEVTIR